MKSALKSMTGGRTASASVVDGKLILSFPDAVTPVVWQMDLTQAKASALEVRENKKDSLYTLVLKTPKGDALEIAPFAKRAQAVEGLMAASKALESAHGQIRPVAEGGAAVGSPVRPKKPASPGRWVAGVLGVFLLVVLFGIWGSLMPRTPSGLSQVNISPAAAVGQNAQDTSGVPVSADDFLQGR